MTTRNWKILTNTDVLASVVPQGNRERRYFVEAKANKRMVLVRRSTARVNCSYKEFGEATRSPPKVNSLTWNRKRKRTHSRGGKRDTDTVDHRIKRQYAKTKKAPRHNSMLNLGADYFILSDFLVDPSEQLFQVVESNVTHVGDSERLFFELAVAVSENGIVLVLNSFDSFGDVYAAGVLDRC